jgi:hypothetical protein
MGATVFDRGAMPTAVAPVGRSYKGMQRAERRYFSSAIRSSVLPLLMCSILTGM